MAYKLLEDFHEFKKGDFLPEKHADALLSLYKSFDDQSIIEIVPDQEKPKSVGKKKFDLNGDGKFDHKDKSIAGRVLASRKKRKSRKK